MLVILILLQSGKEGMGVIFGGGNSSVFGSTGAGGILAKLTTLMAVIFIITSLSYTYVTSSKPASDSVILNVQIEDPKYASPSEAPAADQPATPEGGKAIPGDQDTNQQGATPTPAPEAAEEPAAQ